VEAPDGRQRVTFLHFLRPWSLEDKLLHEQNHLIDEDCRLTEAIKSAQARLAQVKRDRAAVTAALTRLAAPAGVDPGD
jgi:hypothetical protein